MARIIVDAGHGGSDVGDIYRGRAEKDDNLRLALEIGRLLDTMRNEVFYTRTTDAYVSQTDRVMTANRIGGDFLISVHRIIGETSISDTPSLDFYIVQDDPLGEEIATRIGDNLSDVTFEQYGLIVRTDVPILGDINMPGIMIGIGNIQSEEDNQLFDSRFDDIAYAIATGISEVLNRDEPKEGTEELTEEGSEEAFNNTIIRRKNNLSKLKDTKKCNTNHDFANNSPKVIINPGHGGADTGEVIGNRMEKDENLKLAQDVGILLEQYGIEVYYTRTEDADEVMEEIIMLIDEIKPELFLSLHRTSNITMNVGIGMETIVNDNEFAYIVGRNIVNQAEKVDFLNMGIIRSQGFSKIPDEIPSVTVLVGVGRTERGNYNYDLKYLELVDSIAFGVLVSFGVQVDNLSIVEKRNLMRENKSDMESDGVNIVNQDDRIYNESGNNCEDCQQNQQQMFYDENALYEDEPMNFDDSYNNQVDTVTEYRYRVQVGLFRNFNNAMNLQSQLVMQGYPAEIGRQGDFYSVQVGDFPTLDQAAELERILRIKGYPTLLVAV